MQRRSKWTDQVRCWERDICDAIDRVQAISRNEMNSLQLYIDTYPLPFQPSPVLLHLLHNDRRRSSGGLETSVTQSKQQLKSADYLDRKFESEIRQHYELESAQNCGKWRQFHFRAVETRRQLASGIERDFRQFCHQLGSSSDEVLQSNGQHRDKDHQESERSPPTLPGDTTPRKATMSIENTLRFHQAQEWVHQERFNIQEAFTNQTKKLQEELDVLLDQEEAHFLEERQRVLSACTQQCLQPEKEWVARRLNHPKASTQFQSNTKRDMLKQTAVNSVGDGEERIMEWRGGTAESRLRLNFRRFRNDVNETQEKLDVLQRRLQTRQKVAETKREGGMQWIGRQCAHMFAQLDCKEKEARIVALLLEEELTQIGSLRGRVSEIVNILEKLDLQQHDENGYGLPRLSSSSSETRLP